MISLQATADSIRAAVGSTASCTSTTATILNDLLLPKSIGPEPTTTKSMVKPTAAARRKGAKAITEKTEKKVVFADKENKHGDAEQLSAKERSILATEVINATLKVLSEAIKTPAPRKKDSSKDMVKASARKALRKSNSMPMSPLQPRTLNRVSSSPDISNRHSRSSSSASLNPPGNRSTAECARVAFACLRNLQAGKVPGVDLPPLQLENGMSVLIGKLVALQLDDLAIKELRILKRRLGPGDSKPKKAGAPATAPQTLDELLDFGKGGFSDEKLGLVITTQLQVLRLLASSRKYRQIESAVTLLQPSSPSSPTALLLQAAKQSSKQDKSIRQLQSLSDILFSLGPSVSSSDDAVALESRLSVGPDVAYQLQILALHNRSLWWKLAGHEGDSTKELFGPFLRCLSAYARRTQYDAQESYRIASEGFLYLQSILSNLGETIPGPKSVLNGIYRILGSLAQEANQIDQAINWTRKLQGLLDSNAPEAKRSFVAAKLVGLTLRNSLRQPEDEELLLALLEGLERPFQGESSEIDDLLTEVSATRRAAVTLLAKRSSSQEVNSDLTDGMREMCESLVFLYPKLCLRYLGSPPASHSVTKDILRYEQRRQFVTKPSYNGIDSVLFIVRTFLGEGRLTWNLMDSKLQDCLMLLDRLGSSTERVSSENETSVPSYYVKISNLYYTKYLDMRRDSNDSKDDQQLRVLRRSIDCIRTRPQHEKKAAFFSSKLERIAEICKNSKRYDDLFSNLLTLQDEMIDCGALSAINEAVATMPLRAAWAHNEEASTLARTMRTLFQVQIRYLGLAQQELLLEGDWTNDERAAMLEQYLEIISSQSNPSNAASIFRTKVFQELLSLYTRRDFPLRRLRILIRLLSLDIDSRQEVICNVASELEALRIKDMNVDSSKDAGLRGYMVYLQTLATSLLELQQLQPNIDILKQGLVVWSSIRQGCSTMHALESRIEDIPGLLAHLQSIADYLQVKGAGSTRLATLRLITDFIELQNACPNDLVLSFTRLGTQWLQLGYSGKAGLALDRAQIHGHENGVMPSTLLQMHLSYSEYLFAIGNYDKSEEYLLRAQTIAVSEKNSGLNLPVTWEKRTLENQLISKANLVHSMLALERGAPETALIHAKQSVRMLRRAWANVESHQSRQSPRAGSPGPEIEANKLADETCNLSMTTIKLPTSADSNQRLPGTEFWPLVMPLFHAITYLSNLHAHYGMFQETLYYAEQAYTIVMEVSSEAYTAMASAYLGSIWLKAGTLDKGSELLMAAKQLGASLEKTRETALLACHLGDMHGLLGNWDAEVECYEDAEAILQSLTGIDFINRVDSFDDPADGLEEKMASLTVSKKKVAAPRKTPIRPKTVARKKPAARTKSPFVATLSVAEECSQLISLKATLLRKKARAFTFMKKFADALILLNEAENYLNTQLGAVEHGLAMAKQLLLGSMEQMHADPVYSVLQESTISFPAIMGLSKVERHSGDKISVAKSSPPPKRTPATKGRRVINRSNSPTPDSFFDKLRQAQDHLTEAHSMALAVAPVAVIHSITALLNSVAILLSAVGQIKGKPLAHPGFASCSIEMARSLALLRERKAILAHFSKDDIPWSSLNSTESRRSSLAPPQDMSRFQKDYIDIIPKAWTAISIALSDSRNELSITKLEAGYSPFVLRLPLGRNNSMDADEEVFGFEQGHCELLEIIDLANESAHEARNMIGREAKTIWWEERGALDARLRDLLENIEKVWLGGFTGIFSQHARRPDLLARFQKSFSNILDKHLPSRQKIKRSTSPRITLDSRILDLFIGLGDASDENCDFSEPLVDLLYFVVDVLQFHGEPNACDEIDFDSIVVETHDALRGYHEAVRASNFNEEGRHTILILDKALHAFPWESLPCMDGLAVSRLPSLGCLRDRILEQQKDMPETGPPGKYVDRDNGSFILNPEDDLKNTQASFEKSLQSLKDWSGIVKRVPTEDEIKSNLKSKDILLYFGHGSGAQYIRAREIKKLEKCAVTMLMGCSSGALTEAGEFEPYGPPINYMHAGSPALVATLWDVTDKDIDRYFQSTFEHWGLFDKQGEQISRKARGKRRADVGEEKKNTSLVEAVAKSRTACILRYLNAAAVVVYGVPVYIR